MAGFNEFIQDPQAQEDMRQRALTLFPDLIEYLKSKPKELAQQGARGFSSSVLSGFGAADIANILMGGAGGEKPVMGQQWVADQLASRGLLAPAPEDTGEKAAEFGGGLLNPAAIAKGGALAIAAAVPRSQLLKQGAQLEDFASTSASRIAHQTAKNQGYSVHLPTGERPTEGYMVGKYANADPRTLVVPGLPTKAQIEQHAATNRKELAAENQYLGTWHDSSSNQTYLDVVRRFEPDELRTATKYGEKTRQKALWDLSGARELPVGHWLDFINGPEFAQRMAQMQGEGAQYMSTHPSPDWWNMRNTLFEELYGQHLPQVAGFTASTAPVTPLRANVQQMSEYMRRHISGEPVIQPQWRAGQGLLTMQPGSMMPMEGGYTLRSGPKAGDFYTGRSTNLQHAGAGRLDQLSDQKVNAEARAMMGDPNALVLDRWHVRGSESPARGIYAMPGEGVITGPQYGQLEGVMGSAADAAGLERQMHSAQIWAGIRERVRNTGELFGTPYARPPGESKGYVDHLKDLTVEKAAHLGISEKEMKARLKGGDENLLSLLLAIPGVGAAAALALGAEQSPQP